MPQKTIQIIWFISKNWLNHLTFTVQFLYIELDILIIHAKIIKHKKNNNFKSINDFNQNPV